MINRLRAILDCPGACTAKVEILTGDQCVTLAE
jgi:hypothetical protein